MAPEQAAHPLEVDHRADIYSLGVVFYQMLTGELPSAKLEPPSKKVLIDVRLDEVVLRALEKKPELRYQQASQLKTTVETIAQSPEDSARSKGTSKARRIVWAASEWFAVVCAALGCLAALLALGGVLWWNKYERSKLAAAKVKQVSATAARKGDIGEYLDSLGTVNSSNSVFFQIDQKYCQEVIRKFDAHQELPVEASDAQGAKFGHGFLAGVDNLIDTATGTLKCRASLIPDAGNLMVPGMLLNIRLLLEMKHGVTLVPAEAIQRDPQRAFVWVVQSDQTATRRPVRVGTMDGNWAEIQSGLSPGELVASSGLNGLQEGQRVHAALARTASVEPTETTKAGFGETNAQILKIQLARAEEELALTQQNYEAGVSTAGDFYAAQDKVALLKAELRGDPVEIARVNLAAAQRRLDLAETLYKAALITGSEFEAAKTELAIAKVKWEEAVKTKSSSRLGEQHWSFGPVIERTLQIHGQECDFLILRSGEVLRHSFVEAGNLRDETPPSAFQQWVRQNGVDLGFGVKSKESFAHFGFTTFDMGVWAWQSDTIPNAQIPDFRSPAELNDYSARHQWPLKTPPLIGSLVGVTNIWNDLTADQIHESTNDVPTFFLKEKNFARYFADTNFIHPIAFSTREGVEGLMQVTGLTDNPPGFKLRYKLVQDVPAANASP
jgi:hypothetical protein